MLTYAPGPDCCAQKAAIPAAYGSMRQHTSAKPAIPAASGSAGIFFSAALLAENESLSLQHIDYNKSLRLQYLHTLVA
jgi:hypothetical protein